MPQHRKGPRLYLRKVKGYAPLYVILDDGSQRSTGCGEGEFEQAREKLKAYLAETYRIDKRQRALDQIGISDVMKLYSDEHAPGLSSEETIKHRGNAILSFWGEMTLADIKASKCKAYVKFRTETPLKTKFGAEPRFVKPFTAKQELKVLAAAINHWNRESPLPAIPQITYPKATSKRERVLTRKEAAALLWAARELKLNHVARFILIGLYTGTRHDAILRLNWSAGLAGGHTDLERGVLYRRGAAERETSKRRPPVAISRRLRSAMEIWKRADDKDEIHSIIHYNGLSLAKMKRAWTSVVKKAGLGTDVTPHVLRHTCASWLLWKGMTIWEVAGIIGADSSTVERVYGHHQPLEQDERIRA